MTDTTDYRVPMRWCERCECGTRDIACWYCGTRTTARHPLYGQGYIITGGNGE